MKAPELTKLLELIREAPSTVAECAALLGETNRRVQVGMWQLTSTNRAQVVGTVPNPAEGFARWKPYLNLYGAVTTS